MVSKRIKPLDVTQLVALDDIEQDLKVLLSRPGGGGGGIPPGWNEVRTNVQTIKADVQTIKPDVQTTKSNVDKMLVGDPETEGTLTADGTEQTLVQTSSNIIHTISGRIDLSPIGVNDKVVVRIYEKIKPLGSPVCYHEEEYDGAKVSIQAQKLLRIKTHEAKYGIKITFEQTAGPLKDWDYIFYRMKKAG